MKNSVTINKQVLSLILLTQLLLSCNTPEVENLATQEVVIPQIPLEVIEETSSEYGNSLVRARILADILFDARNAFDDDNLMLPAGDNAYDRYMEVLSVDSQNSVALEGLVEIVERYLELTITSINTGQYDNAERLLDRAESINGESNNITSARSELAQARLIKVDMFELDPQLLSLQGNEMEVFLSDIGQYIKDQEATFLITARSDAEGRWIYRVMRESVDGYRLRGNISLGGEPRIQVNIPKA